jgi:acid phosphatase type 7
MKRRVAVLVLAVACRRAPSAGASNAAAPVTSVAIAFPHTPAGCGYAVRPPHAGRFVVTAHAERLGAHPAPRSLHLTFVGDPSNSLVVQWSTDLDTLASSVRLVDDAGRELPRATGYSFPLPGAHARRQHEVHLCGLRPSTRYRYSVGDGAWHTFTTAPDGPAEVRVGVAGDARTDPRTWARVSRAMLSKRPDVLLFTGDAVADGASLALWDAFFEAGAELFAEVPGIWADGNHEGNATVYYDQFALPAASHGEFDEHFYALTYGPLRVITLNDTTESDEDIAGEEVDFLRETLTSVDRARTPWVVTQHHKPIYTDASGHTPDRLTRRVWAPLFDQFHVDLDLSGHVHNYESSEPLRAGVVVEASQGTRYLIFGGGGAPLYGFLAREPWVHARESTHGFGVLTASSTALHWEALRDDGSVIESLDLSRRAP